MLHQGTFRLDSFMETVVKHWNRLFSREVVEFLSLEVFQRHVNMVQRDMV